MRQLFVPLLANEDAGRAAEWLVQAFGLRERERFADARGVVTDVVLELDGAIMLAGHPSDAYRGPREHARTCEDARAWRGVPYVVDGVLVYVEDLESHHARAKAADAVILTEIEANPLQRQYRAEDLAGHRWMFAQRG
jgi:uncharacterized glyoxalase superfamily protein PhnB